MKGKADNLWKTYVAINELIRFADTKATTILAVNGVIAGFYFSNISSIQQILQQKRVALVPLLTAAGFILISSGFSACCIVPRLKMNKSRCLILFCDIAKFESAEAYEKAVEEEMTDGKVEKDLSDQIWANSRIAAKKYDAVTVSVIVFVAVVLASMAFILMASWL
jgi:hypothetical protein